MRPYVSIVLPTYNERANIVELITRIKNVITVPHEICVIDDNSPDGTADIVRNHFSSDSAVILHVRKDKHGLASAIQTGINLAHGNFIVWMDCDLSMPPEYLPSLIVPVVENRCDVAIGSRYVKGGADRRWTSGKPILLFHVFLSILINLFAKVLLSGKSRFRDWTSGFLAAKRDVLIKCDIDGDYGEFFISLVHQLLQQKLKIQEIPYILLPRKYGESKTSTTWLGFFCKGSAYVTTIMRCAWERIFGYLTFIVTRRKQCPPQTC